MLSTYSFRSFIDFKTVFCMKKTLTIIFLFFMFRIGAQPIVGTVPTTICAGATLSISFTLSGSVVGSNIFTAELSDASGSFTTPVSICTLAGTSPGPISCLIPFSTPQGNGYKIRVRSSNPAAFGPASSTAITINALPQITTSILGNSPACSGSTQTYSIATVSGATFYTWILPSGWVGTSTTNSITANVGTVSGDVVVIAKNACGSSDAVHFTVSVPVTDDGKACTADFCSGGVVTHTLMSAGTVCRASVGVCDVAETCNGVSNSCPTCCGCCGVRNLGE